MHVYTRTLCAAARCVDTQHKQIDAQCRCYNLCGREGMFFWDVSDWTVCLQRKNTVSVGVAVHTPRMVAIDITSLRPHFLISIPENRFAHDTEKKQSGHHTWNIVGLFCLLGWLKSVYWIQNYAAFRRFFMYIKRRKGFLFSQVH